MSEERAVVLIAEFTLSDFIQTYLHYYGSYVLPGDDFELDISSENLLKDLTDKARNVNLFDRLVGDGYQDQESCFQLLERALDNRDPNLEQYLEHVLHRHEYILEGNNIKIILGELNNELIDYRKNLIRNLSGQPAFYFERV